MANKYFNVKVGVKTGNIALDAATGNISGGNVALTGTVSALDLLLSGNVKSNLNPNVTNAYSLGNSTYRYKNVYASNANIAGNLVIAQDDGTGTITGNITLGTQTITANATTTSISGNVAVAEKVTANVVVANVANVANINVEILNGNLVRANTANIKLVISQTLEANVANIDTITVKNQLVINSSTDSTSTDTGSIVTAGGVGIQKDLFVGGAIHLANGNGGTTSKTTIKYNESSSGIDFNFNG